jgi:hypothetical protein
MADTYLAAFGGALVASTPFNRSFAIVMATLSCFSIGTIIVLALSFALYACPYRFTGTTTALSLFCRFLGGSVGTTIYFNIFNSKFSKKLPIYVATAAVGAGLPANDVMPFVEAFLAPGEAAFVAQENPHVTITPAKLDAALVALRWAYEDSLSYVRYTTIAFGVICMIFCTTLSNIGRFMIDRIAVVRTFFQSSENTYLLTIENIGSLLKIKAFRGSIGTKEEEIGTFMP